MSFLPRALIPLVLFSASVIGPSSLAAQEGKAGECVVKAQLAPRVLRPLEREPGTFRRVSGNAPRLDAERVKDHFVERLSALALPVIRRCYERHLMNDPRHVSATYVVEVTISAKGKQEVRVVAKEMSSWFRAHGDLEPCILKAIQKMELAEFPRCGTIVLRGKLAFAAAD